MPSRTPSSFNGATLVGAWKEQLLQETALNGPHASTEPRSWERGRLINQAAPVTSRKSFNGATLVGAWKGSDPITLTQSQVTLQRSHARGSVEGARCRRGLNSWTWLQRSHARGSVEGQPHSHAAFAQLPASTEPRSWERGRPPPRPQGPLSRGHCFNGATLVGAWKAASSRVFQLSTSLCFNGATLVGAWKDRQHPQEPIQAPASTEPRSWERGRFLVFDANGNAGGELQRSHARGSVEGLLASLVSPDTHLLQRSHARGSVEGDDFMAYLRPPVPASTEPRSWERGRRPRTHQGSARRKCFNGATLVGAWKGRQDKSN